MSIDATTKVSNDTPPNQADEFNEDPRIAVFAQKFLLFTKDSKTCLNPILCFKPLLTVILKVILETRA